MANVRFLSKETYHQKCDIQYGRCIVYTIDGKRFTGLNVHVFNPTEVFTEILSCCLGQKCLLFSIIKERYLYSWEIFCGTLETVKNAKV